MNKNGFVFVETIIVIVILTGSLLILYKTFTNILQSEKTRVYYDDINYIYRTFYIKNKLDDLNLKSVINEISNNENKSFITIGIEYADLFQESENEKKYISNLLGDFEVNQMIILKENMIDNLKTCNLNCSLDSKCSKYEQCNDLYSNLSDEMVNYIKRLYIDIPCNYVLVVEYNTCNNTNCHNYYSWVSV